MDSIDYLLLLLAVVIVFWYVGWFGTHTGERLINGFSGERWKLFVLFNVSLIIAFALIGTYIITRLGVFK